MGKTIRIGEEKKGQTNMDLAMELAESFVNGNISYVKEEIKNSASPVGLALLVIKYLPESSQRSFMDVFERDMG